MVTSGIIRNRRRAKQLYDLQGMRFGSISPSDIDIALDFGDRLFVLVELKTGDAPVSFGQRLLYQRMIDAWTDAGKDAVAFIASHQTPDPDVDIDVAHAAVCEYRYQRRWRQPKGPITVREAINHLLRAKGLDDYLSA